MTATARAGSVPFAESPSPKSVACPGKQSANREDHTLSDLEIAFTCELWEFDSRDYAVAVEQDPEWQDLLTIKGFAAPCSIVAAKRLHRQFEFIGTNSPDQFCTALGI
jgi:hypothetical protein